MKLKIRLKVFGYMTKRNSKKGTLQKTNRRTMAIIRHMRRSAVSAGRPGGRPDKGNCLESGEIRGNMLTRPVSAVRL